jgi:hypothetical protein
LAVKVHARIESDGFENVDLVDERCPRTAVGIDPVDFFDSRKELVDFWKAVQEVYFKDAEFRHRAVFADIVGIYQSPLENHRPLGRLHPISAANVGIHYVSTPFFPSSLHKKWK